MSVIDTRFPELLRSGRPQRGLFLGIPSPALVEMAGHVGFDFVVIDNEHGPAGIETTEHLIRAARCAGIIPVVRVSGALTQEILRTLDAGASAVQVPQVNTAEQARQVVAAAKYPPQGNRGAAFSTRAAGYGLQGGPVYMERANAGTVVITHIETVDAVQNLDEMLTVEGIDVLFIGPTDLSVSAGYPGNPGHPVVKGMIEESVAKIAAAGVCPGILVTSPQEFEHYAALGVRYLAINAPNLISGAMRSYLSALPS